MIDLQQYKLFILNCTTNANSVNNYSDFKRINECIKELGYNKTILEFDNSVDLTNLINQLNSLATYQQINQKGKEQYSNTLKMYLRFLNAKELFQIVPIKKQINSSNSSLQQIFYGAPGTGKSNTIKRDVEEQGKIHFRTTFHPDSDYSTFVGCYKPTLKSVKKTVVIGQDEKEVKPLTGGTDSMEQISYQFVPQAFTKAYCEAWNHYDEDEESEPVYLIIEEINRGNCAQIFGDIFQLLDRKNGFSEYTIDADEDLKKFLLNGTKDDGTPWLVNKKGIENGQLRLPPNLHIWATMNTSDQSLFPIDSAFKRRWDWRYIKIKDEKKSWTIEGGHDWWKFLEKINKVVLGMTSSADKQLGYFFCKANDANNEISKETFVNKVCFYLWNDVFKSFYSDEYADLFKIKKDGNDGELTFPDFFDDNGNVDSEIAEQFIGNVMKFGESQDKPTENQEAQA